MKGLEIAREYYLRHGKAMLEEQFADVIDRIAVGLVGEGSECFGFDDALSLDHDFDAGFCLLIPREDERRYGFRLERAYAKLPKEFMGLRRSPLSPVGGNRHGVLIIEDFYTKFLGSEGAPESNLQWLSLPPAALAAASNGEVFSDPLGAFSAVREVLLRGYPEDVRKKKLAAHLAMMAQAGQYNYERCKQRGELGAASLCIFHFVTHAISAVYLLNRRYEPFYKWAYRGIRELPMLSDAEACLTALVDLSSKEDASETIDLVAGMLAEACRQEGLSKATCHDLSKHACSVTDGIRDNYLRNLHLMDGI